MKTINLLPKLRQQELRYDSMLHGLWVVACLSLASFVLVFLAQFGTSIYLQARVKAIKNQIVQLQDEVDKQQNTDVKSKVEAENALISDFTALADNSPKWSGVIKAFAALPPPGLKINSFNIDPSTGSISITGVSPTRDLVIELYNNILQDTNDFYNVDYPLENIVQPTNVNFHFTFQIQDKLIK